MGKIAFVFSGQGAQYSGMGRELHHNVPCSADVFRRADRIRPGTSAQCFDGAEEELTRTTNTQPCMFAMELAAAAAVEAAGIKADMTAGFSLGEIAALTHSGAVSFEDGFRLVALRGELMADDFKTVDSTMAAVLKLDARTVENLCTQFEHVYPVNYNCPGQITVSAFRSELEDFMKAVKAAGGRAIPLKVEGGFHAPFMETGAQKFGGALREFAFNTPEITLYSDYTGRPYDGDFAGLLSRQMCSPVRWQNIVEHMIENGADTFIELGPGKTLCGLISKIDSGVRTFHVEDLESLNETVREVKPC